MKQRIILKIFSSTLFAVIILLVASCVSKRQLPVPKEVAEYLLLHAKMNKYCEPWTSTGIKVEPGQVVVLQVSGSITCQVRYGRQIKIGPERVFVRTGGYPVFWPNASGFNKFVVENESIIDIGFLYPGAIWNKDGNLLVQTVTSSISGRSLTTEGWYNWGTGNYDIDIFVFNVNDNRVIMRSLQQLYELHSENSNLIKATVNLAMNFTDDEKHIGESLKDYVHIADFFEKVKEKDPRNQAVIYALNEVNRYKEIYLARVKASEEIGKTEKELQELKEESEEGKEKVIKGTSGEKTTPQAKSHMFELGKEEKITKLEVNIEKQKETLSQLEEMKKQFDEEREKTRILTQQLADKERREQDLIIKLRHSLRNPPVIVIASPQDGTQVEINIINLSVIAEDEEGLEKLEIFLNERPLGIKVERGIPVSGQKYPKRLYFRKKVVLEKGENEIRVRAKDMEGLICEKALTIHYIERHKNIWAAVIGVNDYPNIRKLKYAVNDARAVYDHLIHNNRIPEENVTLLVNENASFTQLRSVLGTHLKSRAGKDDMVIIYFAGHGATEKDMTSPDGDGLEKYLLPYDADPKDLYATALPMTEISRIFNRIQSERLIFIVDSCYSGASGGRTISLTGVRSSISGAFLDRITSGKGRVILTACGANEVSAESDNFQHGIFTYFLLEGLRGKADIDSDGIITVDELYRYVSKKVPQATGQDQHPVRKGETEGELVIGRIK